MGMNLLYVMQLLSAGEHSWLLVAFRYARQQPTVEP